MREILVVLKLAIAAGLAIAGGVAGAFQSISQASSQRSQLEASARQAENNAIIAQNNALLERRNRETQLVDSRRQANIAMGSAFANAGANGFTSGSLYDVISDLGTQTVLQQESIIRNSVAKEQGSLMQSDNYTVEAASARAAKTTGIAGAVGSLIKGASAAFGGGGGLSFGGSGSSLAGHSMGGSASSLF
jgi:3-dehydroquinate dehydratase